MVATPMGRVCLSEHAQMAIHINTQMPLLQWPSLEAAVPKLSTGSSQSQIRRQGPPGLDDISFFGGKESICPLSKHTVKQEGWA